MDPLRVTVEMDVLVCVEVLRVGGRRKGGQGGKDTVDNKKTHKFPIVIL